MSDKAKAAGVPLCVHCCCAAIMLIFFGVFAFQEFDDGNACYSQKVWSPATQDYEMKETTYLVDGATNEDVSALFHKFFIASFYA